MFNCRGVVSSRAPGLIAAFTSRLRLPAPFVLAEQMI